RNVKYYQDKIISKIIKIQHPAAEYSSNFQDCSIRKKAVNAREDSPKPLSIWSTPRRGPFIPFLGPIKGLIPDPQVLFHRRHAIPLLLSLFIHLDPRHNIALAF